MAPARSAVEESESRGGQLLLSQVGNGGEFPLSPGGVCRMLLPAVRHWTSSGWLRQADWFSLQPAGPRKLQVEDLPLTLHHLSLSAEELAAYARTKEKLWAEIHGLPATRFDSEDFRFYTRYNWYTADSLLKDAPELDLAYIHDFQLLQVGALIGLAAPAVFRWHVPFNAHRIPSYTRNFLIRTMEDYDAVIVSTRRDLEGLINAGFRGTARQLYPYIDAGDWPDVSQTDRARLEHDLDLEEDDEVVICVARMDPMKRQDLLLNALRRVTRKRPHVKLVLVGNGSFSGSMEGGLGLTKSQAWATKLERMAADLKIADQVVFAHWLPDTQLAAAYARADIVAMTSDIEGFGLTVLEGWRYGRPCVVSTGGGVSEIVHHGVTGQVFPAGDEDALAERLLEQLGDSELRETMGQAGRRNLRNYDVAEAGPLETAVLKEAVARFGEE